MDSPRKFLFDHSWCYPARFTKQTDTNNKKISAKRETHHHIRCQKTQTFQIHASASSIHPSSPRSSLIVSRIHIWFLPEFLHNLRLNFKYIENYIFCYKAEDELQQCQVEFANQVWKNIWRIILRNIKALKNISSDRLKLPRTGWQLWVTFKWITSNTWQRLFRPRSVDGSVCKFGQVY